MLNRPHVVALAISFASLLAACGGGGGGSGSGGIATVAGGGGGPLIPALPTSTPSSSPVPVVSATPGPGTGSATPSPTPAASATPAPGSSSGATPTPAPSGSATPTPVPSGYYAQGTVRDFDSGAPVAGATVVIAPPVYAGSTPPPGVSTTTTTAADGSFTIASLIPGSNFIEVFANGFATLHKKLNVTSFNNQLGSVSVTLLTSDQTAWLAQLNADRAAWNAPPVVFDEILVEGARHWVSYMGTNGWYQRTCPSSDPSCQTAVQYETAAGGTFTTTGSNIDAELPPSTWRTAESHMMAESANCPQPASAATCPNANAPEFLNIINSNYIWTGLAEMSNGKGFSIANPFIDYYDEEFATPIHQ